MHKTTGGGHFWRLLSRPSAQLPMVRTSMLALYRSFSPWGAQADGSVPASRLSSNPSRFEMLITRKASPLLGSGHRAVKRAFT